MSLGNERVYDRCLRVQSGLLSISPFGRQQRSWGFCHAGAALDAEKANGHCAKEFYSGGATLLTKQNPAAFVA